MVHTPRGKNLESRSIAVYVNLYVCALVPRIAAVMPPAGHLPGEPGLATEAHVKYIQSLDTKKDELDYWLTEHLRLNGVYWGLTALHLLGRPDALPRDETVDFVLSCQHDNGGFGAAPGHDAHMLSTVSAVQILAMVDAFEQLETRGTGKAKVGKCGFFISSFPTASPRCVAPRL